MHRRVLLLLIVLVLGASFPDDAQQGAVERLAPDTFDVVPPSARVRGAPGVMTLQALPCRVSVPAQIRRRIVDVAVQEWGFFGFPVVDWTDVAARAARRSGTPGTRIGRPRGGRPRSWLSEAEAARVASSIAGYWAVTPEGPWIVGQQNEHWNGPDGIASRWNAPWSAAFISWVMCEAGLGATDRFRRAVAHHVYMDQGIRARDGRAPDAAFVAYDTGEAAITPGDLLCSSRRPVYRTIAERRRQMGAGARTHCDVVVTVDDARSRILAIGGNVRGTVSLKLLAAQREPGKPLRVLDPDEDARPIFAHLKLRAAPIAADALETSATWRAFGCRMAARVHATLAAAGLAPLVSRC